MKQKELAENFEKLVLDYIGKINMISVYHMSDFYEDACKLLKLDWEDFYPNQNKIRYRLNKMRKKGLIDCRRCGTGYCGKTDFGHSSANVYTMPDFWID